MMMMMMMMIMMMASVCSPRGGNETDTNLASQMRAIGECAQSIDLE